MLLRSDVTMLLHSDVTMFFISDALRAHFSSSAEVGTLNRPRDELLHRLRRYLKCECEVCTTPDFDGGEPGVLCCPRG